MARQQNAKTERGAAKTRQTKPKTETKATASTTTKTAKSTRTSAKSKTTVEKSMLASEVTAGIGPTFDEVRQRAYEIYLARGATPGDPTADWLRAEKELRELRVARLTTGRARRESS